MSNGKGFFSPKTHKDLTKPGIFYNIANYYIDDVKYW